MSGGSIAGVLACAESGDVAGYNEVEASHLGRYHVDVVLEIAAGESSRPNHHRLVNRADLESGKAAVHPIVRPRDADLAPCDVEDVGEDRRQNVADDLSSVVRDPQWLSSI